MFGPERSVEERKGSASVDEDKVWCRKQSSMGLGLTVEMFAPAITSSFFLDVLCRAEELRAADCKVCHVMRCVKSG